MANRGLADVNYFRDLGSTQRRRWETPESTNGAGRDLHVASAAPERTITVGEVISHERGEMQREWQTNNCAEYRSNQCRNLCEANIRRQARVRVVEQESGELETR